MLMMTNDINVAWNSLKNTYNFFGSSVYWQEYNKVVNLLPRNSTLCTFWWQNHISLATHCQNWWLTLLHSYSTQEINGLQRFFLLFSPTHTYISSVIFLHKRQNCSHKWKHFTHNKNKILIAILEKRNMMQKYLQVLTRNNLW